MDLPAQWEWIVMDSFDFTSKLHAHEMSIILEDLKLSTKNSSKIHYSI